MESDFSLRIYESKEAQTISLNSLHPKTNFHYADYSSNIVSTEDILSGRKLLWNNDGGLGVIVQHPEKSFILTESREAFINQGKDTDVAFVYRRFVTRCNEVSEELKRHNQNKEISLAIFGGEIDSRNRYSEFEAPKTLRDLDTYRKALHCMIWTVREIFKTEPVSLLGPSITVANYQSRSTPNALLFNGTFQEIEIMNPDHHSVFNQLLEYRELQRWLNDFRTLIKQGKKPSLYIN